MSSLTRRIYRVKWWVQAIALACVLFFTFMAFGVWLGKIPPEEPGTPIEYGLIGSTAAVLLCVGWAAYVFTAYVAIGDGGIESGSLFGRKSLPAGKIFRSLEYEVLDSDQNKIRYLQVQSTDPQLPSIKLRKGYFSLDREFHEWLRNVSELARIGGSSFGASAGASRAGPPR